MWQGGALTSEPVVAVGSWEIGTGSQSSGLPPASGEDRRRRILVVDDEVRIVQLLSRALGDCGFEIGCALDGAGALDRLRGADFDIVLLDLVLREVDGFETLQRMRAARPSQQIIVLSALSDVRSKVRCFELGASDYIVKPVILAELVARIRARIRQSQGDPAAEERYLLNGRLVLDLHRHAAIDGDRTVPLSTREFFLLERLMRCEGQVCTREELLQSVWGYSFDPGTNVVDVCVRRLRRKLGRNVIETVRNVGYCYGDPP